MRYTVLCLVLSAAMGQAAQADPAEVIDAEATKTGMGWRISATLRHGDTGWDHYADAWRVEDTAGTVIGTRELLHPHVQEQPFTRSLSSVLLPDGLRELVFRARCTEDGWSDTTFSLTLR